MKFFNTNSIKENKIFFILFFIIIFLARLLILANNIKLNYFNLAALIISLSIWVLSTLIDSKTYYNIGAFLVSIIFGYGVFWFMFEIFAKAK